MPINFIPWFQRSILIVFRKIQEVLRRSQNYEKFRFSLRHLARFLKMALTLSCLSDYNFSNFPYSGLILPFVLSTMMYVMVVQFLSSWAKYTLGGNHPKEANFVFVKGPIQRFRVSITLTSKSRLLSDRESKEMYFILPYINLVSWRNFEGNRNFDPN